MNKKPVMIQPPGKQAKEGQYQVYQQKEQEKETPMNTPIPILIIVGLLIVGGVVYFGIKRLIERTEVSNLDYLESIIRNAFAEAAASRLHTTVDDIQRVLLDKDLSSNLSPQLRSEFRECRVSFNPSEKNLVLMIILITWRNGQVTKIEQKHSWEMLPENVRAALIRTQRPYEYSWSLPLSDI